MNPIAARRTSTGLRGYTEIGAHNYPQGVKVTGERMQQIRMAPGDFCAPQSGYSTAETPRRAWSWRCSVAKRLGDLAFSETLPTRSQGERKWIAPEVARRCAAHVDKQRAGASGTTLQVAPSSQLASALQELAQGPRESPERVTARNVIKAASDAKAKRDPQDRHKAREVALYVDLDTMGTKWSRPCEVASSIARAHITEAVGDYAFECDALRDGVIENDFPSMAKTRHAMKPQPVLLGVIWPSTDAG